MRDRFSCLLIAALTLAAGQIEVSAQGSMRAGRGPGNYPNRSDLADTAPMATAVSPLGMPPAMGNSATLLDPNRRLQQGDELSIKIEEDREAAIPLVITHTGEVLIEPLDRPVKLAGLTTTQASANIKALLEKDYYYRATVRLALVRANYAATMGSVSLSGKVARIGMLPISGEKSMKLSEAILAAGGFALYADDRRVRVTRLEGGKTVTLTVDCKAIMNEAKVEKDLTLRDGDRIFVPTKLFQY
jgi:polysaccharide export outer membrane protein